MPRNAPARVVFFEHQAICFHPIQFLDMIFDLSSGNSVWKGRTLPVQVTPPASLSAPELDILIIGTGVCGALIGERLAADGHSVDYCDVRPPAAGSTTASTAIIQYELDVPLYELRTLIPRDDADFVYRESFSAVQSLRDAVCGLPDDAQHSISLRSQTTLQLACTAQEESDILRESEAQESLGYESRSVSKESLAQDFAIAGRSAIANPYAFDLNPVALTHALLFKALQAGSRVLGGEVRNFEQVGSRVHVTFRDGCLVKCRRLIVAAGYQTRRLARLRVGKLTSSYAGATAPGWASPEDPLRRAVLWEAGHPYHYVRSTVDGRVIVGGRDKPFRNPFLRDVAIPLERYRLGRRLQQITERPKPKFSRFWSGTFAESDDGMPFLGPMPNASSVYLVFACGGNGTNFASMARELVASWAIGRSERLHAIFRLDRET